MYRVYVGHVWLPNSHLLLTLCNSSVDLLQLLLIKYSNDVFISWLVSICFLKAVVKTTKPSGTWNWRLLKVNFVNLLNRLCTLSVVIVDNRAKEQPLPPANEVLLHLRSLKLAVYSISLSSICSCLRMLLGNATPSPIIFGWVHGSIENAI